jgi:flagellin-specific chaperone FliS
MINTLSIFHELEETMERQAAEKIAEVIGRVYDELLHTVTKEEFSELKEIVAI